MFIKLIWPYYCHRFQCSLLLGIWPMIEYSTWKMCLLTKVHGGLPAMRSSEIVRHLVRTCQSEYDQWMHTSKFVGHYKQMIFQVNVQEVNVSIRWKYGVLRHQPNQWSTALQPQFTKSRKVWNRGFNWPLCAGFQCSNSKEISHDHQLFSSVCFVHFGVQNLGGFRLI